MSIEVEGEAAPAAAATRLSGETAPAGGGNTSQRIAAEVEKQTKSLRRATLVLFALLIVVAGGYFWQKATYEKRIAQMQHEMLATVDSIRHASDTITVRFAAMQGMVDSARRTTAALGARIQTGGDVQTMQELRAQLTAAMAGQAGLQAAARLDAAHVDSVAGDAVALVIVKFPGDHKFSGTAWAIRSDAEGAYLVTNRHVVTSHEGEDPVEIGVMFNHSKQFFRATLVRKHPNNDVDLALLRVQIHGGVPVIPGVASDAPVVGEPVVSIGFPLGLDLQGSDLARQGANATLTAGRISRLTDQLVQLDGYGATGASGSPILDQHGHVVAVLYGGQQESGGRIVYAVPASYIAELFNGQ
ncbi:MAG: trypsin-like peptidase domain-containing protein [Gemmatimonadetes bacterium]|nr:trypsin-like peptidase domain-containing protein [Gemmatimonadota bacterium]